MKKTLAAIGASAIGLVSAAAGTAAPAAAADVTTPCTDISDHVFATGELPDNFYLDCVPQYGLGKAEFTIVPSDTDPTATFPEDFLDLSDEGVAKTTTLDGEAIGEYFEGIPSPIYPGSLSDGDEFHQTYIATIIAPITSVAGVTDENLIPGVVTECDLEGTTYEAGYVATFAPTDTTFTQTAGGREWKYEVATSPLPTYFFATFDLVSGGVDETQPWCISDGTHTWSSVDGLPVPPDQFYQFVFHTLFDFDGEEAPTLGVFAPEAQPIAPAAVLADTGVDATPLIIGAGAFTLFGAAMLAFTRIAGRRRRA